MKICIFTDCHFGAKKNNSIFLKSQLRFIREIMIPYLKEHKIDTIIHGGDWFDNRNSLDINVLNQIDDLLLNDFKDFKMFMLVGNHDSHLKNTINVHSLVSLKHLKNITVVDTIKKIKIENRDILLVPWQVDKDLFAKKVSDKNFHCDVSVGHFEINGFNLNNAKVCDFGNHADMFLNNFTITLSGHFHKRKLIERGKNKVQYIGNPYELNRGDRDQEKGFCVLDLKTLNYEFINNDISIKYKQFKFPDVFEEKDIKGNMVDVIVDISDDYDEKQFQKYVEEIQSMNPAFPIELKLENKINVTSKGDYKIQNTEELIEEYINDMDDVDEKTRLNIKEKMINVYKECRREI